MGSNAMSIELFALVVGAINGFVLLVKPIGRIHSRIDLLEYRVAQLESDIAKMRSQGYLGDS
jgi:outer membrane murein-binding lipoprotein Lpp